MVLGTTALTFLLGGVLLSAAPARVEPFRIRILEQKHPTSVRVEVHTGALECDGKPLSVWLARVRANGKKIDVGEGPASSCAAVRAPDPSVRLSDGEERRYRGVLDITNKNGELVFLNTLALDEYLPSVVGSEMHAGVEALRAQAIVSRTYAVSMRGRHKNEGYDLCDLTHCQLYLGRQEETPATVTAVTSTQGQVLLVDGAVLPAFFHANCGGATSNSQDVFGERAAGAGVTEILDNGVPICGQTTDFAWKWTVSRTALAKALGVKATGRAVQTTLRDPAGRVLELRAFNTPLGSRDFQTRVAKTYGHLQLRSLKFSVEEVGDKVQFTGFGMGHGVGLCQQGATAMAARGDSFKTILQHYFPDAALGASP